MTLNREVEIFGAHAGSIVDDADQGAPAGFNGNIDPPRARIECVLDQFLHDGGRPLDDLARGDAINKDGIKAADRHGRAPSQKFSSTILLNMLR